MKFLQAMSTRSFYTFWNTCSTRLNGNETKRWRGEKQLNTRTSHFKISGVWNYKYLSYYQCTPKVKLQSSTIWCVHKTFSVGQAAPRAHTRSNPWTQSPGPACSGRSRAPLQAMAGTPLPAETRRRMRWTFITPAPSRCSHTDRDTHSTPLRPLWRRAGLPPARVPAKYNRCGIIYSSCFGERQLRATVPPGWKREHNVFHHSGIFCSLQEVVFF